MNRVVRHLLEPGTNSVVMHRGSKILSAGFVLTINRSNGSLQHELHLWALAPLGVPDPDQPLAHYEERVVLVAPERADVPPGAQFVSSVVVNSPKWGPGFTSWHVFDLTPRHEEASEHA